jgi:hypothetical protein
MAIGIGLCLSIGCAHAQQSRLVGVWSVKSLTVTPANGKPFMPLGDHPIGYAIFSRGGHISYLATAATRPNPAQAATDAEAAALFRTLNAYTGTYRLQGRDRMLVHIDDAWLPSWNGIDQTRTYKITGRELVIKSKNKSPINGEPTTITATLERIE